MARSSAIGHHRLTRRAFLRRAAVATGALVGAAALNRSTWWPASIGIASGPGVAGAVVDLLTGEPVQASVTVSLAYSGTAVAAVTTERDGRFSIPLDPGSYELQTSSPGHLNVARVARIDTGPPVEVSFTLLPANPTEAQQDLIYAKTVHQPQWPPPGEDPLKTRSGLVAAAVDVPETIVVRFPDGSQTTMAVDEYLRHVVPAEMPPTWGREALRAQAVAARTYALAYAQARGYVCTTVYCQAYGLNTYSESDEAVWSTHGQVATYDSRFISAVYFAQCNGASTHNSEEAWARASYRTTCEAGGWNYAAYLRAAPCSGHSRYAYNDCGYHGHGVGMCQWGARGFGQQGLTYDQILKRFYTGIQITRTSPQLSSPYDGYLQLQSSPLTLRWNGGSDQYQVTITGSDSRTWSSGWISTLAHSPSLLAGRYRWSVAGRSADGPDGQSDTWRFGLADNTHSVPVGNVKKNL